MSHCRTRWLQRYQQNCCCSQTYRQKQCHPGGLSTARSGGSTSPSTGQTQHLTALGYVIAGSPIPAEGRGWLGDVIHLAGLNCESLSKIYTIAMFLLGMLFSPEVGARKLNSLNLDTWKPGEKPEHQTTEKCCEKGVEDSKFSLFPSAAIHS